MEEERQIITLIWSEMDFGTEEHSLCGICGCDCENPWAWRKGDLQEDIICEECDAIYEYDCDEDEYKKKESKK